MENKLVVVAEVRVYSLTNFTYKIRTFSQPNVEFSILGNFPNTSCDKSYSMMLSNIIFKEIFYVTAKADLLREKEIQKRMWGGSWLTEVGGERGRSPSPVILMRALVV